MQATSEGDVEVGEASVHWARRGSGPALVFLHGFPLSGRTWDGVIDHLADRFTCYAPDVVGFGQSRSRLDADHSSQGQARLLQRALAALGVGSYALVGNDSGGWIARELALLDRERVTHLVLTNTEIPGHRPPWIPMYQLGARLPGFGRIVQALLGLRAFRRSPMGFRGCFHDLDHLDGEFHRKFVEPLLASSDRIAGAMTFLRSMDFRRIDEFRALHRELAMPVLFVWGRDDPFFPEARGRQMAEQFPNVAGFHSVPQAKLFFYEEYPQLLAGRIVEFAG